MANGGQAAMVKGVEGGGEEERESKRAGGGQVERLC
jgi:hypothetical protein